jgi:hypothetical protein
LPEVVEITRTNGGKGAFWFHDLSPIYIDGSGMYGKCIEVRTAASAAVQKRAHSHDEWDCISWPVPDEIDQTSVVSEILALLIALRHMETGVKYVVFADCMAVILGFAKSYSDLRGRGRHDGLWKQIYEAREGKEVTVLKTKAHRSKLQAIAEDDLENFEGNEAADSEAKRSASMHGHPPATCEEAELRQGAKRKGVAWTLATLKKAAIDLPEVPRRVSRANKARLKVADWEGIGCLLVPSLWGGLVCQMCFSKVDARPKGVKRCSGLNTAAVKVIECGKGNDHDLWVGRQVGGAYDGSPMFMCKNCGAYASAQCKALKKVCTRSWGGRHNGYRRFMRGEHPCLPKVLIEGQRVITPSDVTPGVRSCARHEVYWSKSSEGGKKRPPSIRGPPGREFKVPRQDVSQGSAGAGARGPPRIPPVGDEEDWPDEFGAGPDDGYGFGPGSPPDDGLGIGGDAEFFGLD